MKTFKKLFFSFFLAAGLIIACKEENFPASSSTLLTIPEPAINNVPDPFPYKGYVLTSSMEADPTLAGQNFSAINSYMKNFGFEYSEHPNCTGGYGGHIEGIHRDVEMDTDLDKHVFRFDIHIDPRICFLLFSRAAIASDPGNTDPGCAIKANDHATHIAGIKGDTLTLINGSTYSFTVDTPEDQGLISTKTDVDGLLLQITSQDGSKQKYQFFSREGFEKNDGEIAEGDRLVVTSQDGDATRTYHIALQKMALRGVLRFEHDEITVNTTSRLILYFTAGQRTPEATVNIQIPSGISITLENTTVNVIGRGEVKLKDLDMQSTGRTGNLFSYSKVGNVAITKLPAGGSLLTFTNLDLRPANRPDLVITIANVKLNAVGQYAFRASYTTSKPEILTSPGAGPETATLTAKRTICDFTRMVDSGSPYKESPDRYTQVSFRWSSGNKTSAIELLQSSDERKTWKIATAQVDARKGKATVSGLERNKLYTFKLSVKNGERKGYSNLVHFFSGKMDIKNFGVSGDGLQDNTEKINEAIDSLSKLGGGTLLFSKGIYSVRTVHLKSNLYIYLDKDATIKALKGADAPESTWFSDKKYRSGLSPTDTGPYADPENFLTKQDVGHTFFRNSMFFGERLDNVKIIGNGRITGDGNLVTGDKVMNNGPDNRADKMFTFKLCTNIEIGGLYREEDLWYDSVKDEPYYIMKGGAKDFDVGNMLNIDRGGHFVLLATGTDNIHVHNTYFARHSNSNVRDIYDFMACNNVTVTNIYSKVSSDDIVKPGSDCSLGFTRPARNYLIRNIIGDTNCNLFQIGSETADDIMDVHVDNIYVLGANKAGFSISSNDGGYIKDIHLNCGHTGTLHSRSRMLRTFTPFFISISNRGRILGAEAGRYKFTDKGEQHDELLIKNVNIGQVENIILNDIDITEAYRGSSYQGERWKAYDGSQRRATPIVAGYSLPDRTVVEGGLDFTLPNGKHTGYIKNVVFNDVKILVKGGNPLSDTAQGPPELGVGQYNVSNLKVQPSHGLWARHVTGLTIKDCSFNYENRDSRYAIFLDDVREGKIMDVKIVRPRDNDYVIKLKNASAITIQNVTYYHDKWGYSPTELSPEMQNAGKEEAGLPKKM